MLFAFLELFGVEGFLETADLLDGAALALFFAGGAVAIFLGESALAGAILEDIYGLRRERGVLLHELVDLLVGFFVALLEVGERILKMGRRLENIH